MTWKIVSDSGCDYRELEDIALETSFESVPLTIQVGEEVFIDNVALDIDTMMDKMYATSTASKSACPSQMIIYKLLLGQIISLLLQLLEPYPEVTTALK